MTVILRSPLEANSNLPTIDLLPQEQEINLLPSLTSWFRGDTGFGADGVWQDRGGRTRLSPYGDVPAQPSQATGGQNGKSYLAFKSSGNPGILAAPPGSQLIRAAADWTISVVGRVGNTRAFVGNALSTNYFLIRLGSGGRLDVLLGSTTAVVNSGANTYTDQPILVTFSYKHSPRDMRLRVNGAEVAASTSVVQSLLNERLLVGAAWDGSGTDWINANWNGRLFELLSFNEALHENAPRLALEEGYLLERYAL